LINHFVRFSYSPRYVLTTLFSFDVIFDQFCSSMAGFLPEDCANIL